MSDVFQSGFEIVESEQKRQEVLRADRQKLNAEFWVKEGESMLGAAQGSADQQGVRMRFLAEEPISFRQHNFQIGKTYPKYTCIGEKCPLCLILKDSPRFVGVFPVHDYRTGTVKHYLQGIRVMNSLSRLHMMEGGLTGKDFVVIRAGKGTDTTYNFLPQPATDFPVTSRNPDGNLKASAEVVDKDSGKVTLVTIRDAYAGLTEAALVQVAASMGGTPVPSTAPAQAPNPAQTTAPATAPNPAQEGLTTGVNF